MYVHAEWVSEWVHTWVLAHLSSGVCLLWRPRLALRVFCHSSPLILSGSWGFLYIPSNGISVRTAIPTWADVVSEKLSSSLCTAWQALCSQTHIPSLPSSFMSFIHVRRTRPSTEQWEALIQHLQVTCSPCPAESTEQKRPTLTVGGAIYTLEPQSGRENQMTPSVHLSIPEDTMWEAAFCSSFHAFPVMKDYVLSNCEPKQTIPPLSCFYGVFCHSIRRRN